MKRKSKETPLDRKRTQQKIRKKTHPRTVKTNIRKNYLDLVELATHEYLTNENTAKKYATYGPTHEDILQELTSSFYSISRKNPDITTDFVKHINKFLKFKEFPYKPKFCEKPSKESRIAILKQTEKILLNAPAFSELIYREITPEENVNITECIWDSIDMEEEHPNKAIHDKMKEIRDEMFEAASIAKYNKKTLEQITSEADYFREKQGTIPPKYWKNAARLLAYEPNHLRKVTNTAIKLSTIDNITENTTEFLDEEETILIMNSFLENAGILAEKNSKYLIDYIEGSLNLKEISPIIPHTYFPEARKILLTKNKHFNKFHKIMVSLSNKTNYVLVRDNAKLIGSIIQNSNAREYLVNSLMEIYEQTEAHRKKHEDMIGFVNDLNPALLGKRKPIEKMKKLAIELAKSNYLEASLFFNNAQAMLGEEEKYIQDAYVEIIPPAMQDPSAQRIMLDSMNYMLKNLGEQNTKELRRIIKNLRRRSNQLANEYLNLATFMFADEEFILYNGKLLLESKNITSETAKIVLETNKDIYRKTMSRSFSTKKETGDEWKNFLEDHTITADMLTKRNPVSAGKYSALVEELLEEENSRFTVPETDTFVNKLNEINTLIRDSLASTSKDIGMIVEILAYNGVRNVHYLKNLAKLFNEKNLKTYLETSYYSEFEIGEEEKEKIKEMEIHGILILDKLMKFAKTNNTKLIENSYFSDRFIEEVAALSNYSEILKDKKQYNHIHMISDILEKNEYPENYSPEEYIGRLESSEAVDKFIKRLDLILENPKRHTKSLITIKAAEEFKRFFRKYISEENYRELVNIFKNYLTNTDINKFTINSYKSKIKSGLVNMGDCLGIKGKYSDENINFIKNPYSTQIFVNTLQKITKDMRHKKSKKSENIIFGWPQQYQETIYSVNSSIGRLIATEARINDKDVLYVAGFSGEPTLYAFANWKKHVYDAVVSIGEKNKDRVEGLFFDLNPLNKSVHSHEFSEHVARELGLRKGEDYTYEREEKGKGLGKPQIFKLNNPEWQEIMIKRKKGLEGNFFLESVRTNHPGEETPEYGLVYDKGYVIGKYLEL